MRIKINIFNWFIRLLIWLPHPIPVDSPWKFCRQRHDNVRVKNYLPHVVAISSSFTMCCHYCVKLQLWKDGQSKRSAGIARQSKARKHGTRWQFFDRQPKSFGGLWKENCLKYFGLLRATCFSLTFYRPPSTLPRRNLISVLTFFGCFCAYAQRVNLSIAIVDKTAVHTSTRRARNYT